MHMHVMQILYRWKNFTSINVHVKKKLSVTVVGDRQASLSISETDIILCFISRIYNDW